MKELEIRPAREDDVALIHSFIMQLAEHEGDTDIVVTTEEDVRAAFFGETPHAECVIAFGGDTPLGSAIFCPKYSSWTGRYEIYLEDLIVTEEARGRGVGKRLMAHLAQQVLERGGTTLEWFVTKKNDAVGFYERLGAKALDQVAIMRLRGDELSRLAGGE